jgi:hypothetical protein
MKFRNETSKTIKIRRKGTRWYDWIKIDPSETIEVTRDEEAYAKDLGLTEVSNKQIKTTESTINDRKVETKQIEEVKQPSLEEMSFKELKELGKQHNIKSKSKKGFIEQLKEI